MRTSTLARLLVAITAVAVLGGEGRGQSTLTIYTNPITGTNPNTSNPYTTGQTVAPNLTGVGVGRGPGITGTNANNRYNANSWNTPSFDSTQYFSILFSPSSGFAVDVSSFSMTSQTSTAGPNTFALRTSQDNFATDTTPATHTATAISYTPTDLTNLTATNSGFRIYGWGTNDSAGTYSVNDFTIQGLVSNRWSGASSSDFAADGNWVSGSAPGVSYTSGVQFEGSTNTNVQISSDTSVRGIRFASGASSFNLAGAGVITLNDAGGISNHSANQQTISGNLALAAPQNLYSSVGNLQIDGVISSVGTTDVAKRGTGTVTLSRGNLYTGNTSVNAGTLRVTNTIGSATSTGTVTVASSGTLRGTGAVSGLVTVENGGTIRGDTAGNALSLGGGLTTQAGATIGVTLFSANSSGTAGGSTQGTLPNTTSNTFIELTGGTTSISSTTRFTIDGTGLTFTPGDSYSYQILSGAGNQSALNITAQSLFTATGFDASPWTFSVTGTNAGAVYLNFAPVPEPATVLAVGAAGLGAISWLRRKRKAKAETAATA